LGNLHFLSINHLHAIVEENERLFPSAKIAKPQPATAKATTAVTPEAPQPKTESAAQAKPADAPAIVNQSGMRTGALQHLKIFCNTPEVHDQTVVIKITSDTYIAEVLDIICKKKHLDSSRHSLRLHGTSTIVPLDRIVQELQGRSELELVVRGAFDPISDRNGSSPLSNPPSKIILTSRLCLNVLNGCSSYYYFWQRAKETNITVAKYYRHRCLIIRWLPKVYGLAKDADVFYQSP
jgi:hypothetical protein